MANGFFLQDIDFKLPHPKISKRTILLFCKVIKKAWRLLGENPPSGFSLKSADEDTITLELVWIIENRLRQQGEVKGFDSGMFGRVSREPKVTNFDKKHPDKMPDIFFGLKRNGLPTLSEQDGLFVECKPVDRNHSVSAHYCKKGLARFVMGDYAWAMQEALMVGYVTAPYSFTKPSEVENLSTVLDDKKSCELNTKSHFKSAKFEIYYSTHDRKFEWLENRGKACSIAVSHLWLFK